MTQDEKILEAEVKVAVLSEKVSRLETIVYGVVGFVLLQVFGLFILWVNQIMSFKN